MLPLTKTLLGLVWVFLVQGDTESNITSSGDVGGLPQSCSSVRTSHSLAAQGLFRAAQLLLCCQSSLYLVHKERMEKGSRKHPRASSTDTGQGRSGQTSWASLPWPSPPALLWSWVESGAASAGPGWHWHCISSGPAPSPPLPSAKAPAVLACSSKLKAKPAVESTALAQGANPCVQRPHSPHSCLQANGAVLGTGVCSQRPPHRGGKSSVGPSSGRLHQPHSTCAGLWLCQGAPRSRCRHPRASYGDFTKPLIHVTAGRSDPRCGAHSLTCAMAAKPESGKIPRGKWPR